MEQFEIDNDSSSFEPVNLNMARNVAPSFQNPNANASYPMTSAATATATPTLPTTNVSNATTAPTPTSSWYQKITSFFTIATLEKHFNIDTIDFRNRIISAVLDAHKPNYFREQVLLANGGAKQPDLYGPVWITMTLVFFLAVTGNTAKYLGNDAKDVQYDIGHLTKAFSILMFYTFVLPFVIFVMFHCVDASMGMGWVDIVSVYGYSLVPYIPATILCLVPSVWLEWLFLFVATVMSLMLVLRNVVTPLMRNGPQRWSGPISMCIVMCHFIFFLVLKLVFYRHRFPSSPGGKNSGRGGSGGGGGGGLDDDGNDVLF
jgi:hypothetical protein